MFRNRLLLGPLSFKVLSPRGHDDERLVHKFITPSYQWNTPQLMEYLCQEDVELITRLPISPSAPNKWIWHMTSMGGTR